MSESKKLELTPSVAILIAGVIIAGAIVFVGKFPTPAQQGAEVGGENQASTNVSSPNPGEHIYGRADAPIVLIEYSDFQCPYCQRIHATLKKIVDESNGEIAWIYRHFPLDSIHPEARPSAVASECVVEQLGNNAFWTFADTVFADQKGMGAAQYKAIASQMGADPVRFASCLSGTAYDSKIEEQSTEAQINGGSGTPYTIVWSKNAQVPLSGALPENQIKAVINQVKSRL